MMDHKNIQINKDVDSFLNIISEAKSNCIYIAKGVHEEEFFKEIKKLYIPLYNDTSGKLIHSATSTLDIEPIRNFLVNAGTGKPSVLFINEPSIKDTTDKFNIYVRKRGEEIDPRVIKSILGNSIDFYCSLEKDMLTGEYIIHIAQISYDTALEELITTDVYRGEASLITTLSENKVKKFIRRGIAIERLTTWVSEDTIQNIK